MATPRTATLSGTFSWSNGTPFDGFVLIGLALPENANGQWPVIAADGVFPPQRLPVWIFVPVIAGVIDPHTKLLYNADINPPNSQYVAYWYDANRRRIHPAPGNNPIFFTVAASPYTLANPTLTAPTTTAIIPSPQDTGV